MLKPFNTKLDVRQLRALDEISRTTHIPKASLVRKAIDSLVEEYKEDVISPEFLKISREILNKNEALYKKLSKG